MPGCFRARESVYRVSQTCSNRQQRGNMAPINRDKHELYTTVLKPWRKATVRSRGRRRCLLLYFGIAGAAATLTFLPSSYTTFRNCCLICNLCADDYYICIILSILFKSSTLCMRVWTCVRPAMGVLPYDLKLVLKIDDKQQGKQPLAVVLLWYSRERFVFGFDVAPCLI